MDISKLNTSLASTLPNSTRNRPKIREHRQMMNSSKFRKPSDIKKNITETMASMEIAKQLNRNPKTVGYERNTTAARRKTLHEKYGRVYNLPPITLKQNITNLIKKNQNATARSLRTGRSRFQRAALDSELNFIIANDHDVKDKIFIASDGNLMTINGLDREESDFYKISVIAEYSHGPVATAGIYQINIIVEDENDNAPQFDHTSYVGVIAENSALGTEVLLNNMIFVKDLDAGRNAEFAISILGDGNRLFTVEKSNGTNRDSQKKQTFHNLNATSLTYFSDSVLDEYSNMIDKKLMNLHLMMMSSDDNTENNQTNYVIKFVGPSTLDRERKNFYKLRLQAKDTGGLTSEAQLMVFITDVNDNPPIFDKLAVFKNAGVEILQYSDKMEIYFVDQMQSRNPSGEDSTDYELSTMRARSNVTRFSIREKFVATEASPLTKSPIRIRYRKPIGIGSPRNIKDEDDAFDEIFEDRAFKENYRNPYDRNLGDKYPIFAIEENALPGTTLLQFTATDDDYGNNAQITYEILSENILPLKYFRQNTTIHQNYFTIDRISGELKVNRILLPQVEVKLNISAKDSANLRDDVVIGIQVVDVNNNAPVFKRSFYSFDIEEGFHINKILGTIEASDEDYEDNANITYKILNPDNVKLPFTVTSSTGILKVSGDLDREQKGVYEFQIMAQDNSKRYPLMNSTVEIEINVVDKNDNTPQFIGYDDLMVNEISSSAHQENGRKLTLDENDDLRLEDEELERQNKTPVYKISLSRHIRPRRFVKQVQAIDIDFAGNGNGLVMYGIKHSNVSFLFDIDPREGIITTTSSYEQLKTLNDYDYVNLTIIASDLGNPVKTSYAMLIIDLEGEKNVTTTTSTSTPSTTERVRTMPTKSLPMFPNKYFEIEVLENNQVPLKILKLNTSNNYELYKWSIVNDDQEIDDLFNIEDGNLWLLQSLDREERDVYDLKVKAEVIAQLTMPARGGRQGKKMQIMYPVNDERVAHLK